jgi:hypothetical protein
MSIFKRKVVVIYGLIGISCLLLGVYMAVFGEAPSLAGNRPLISLDGIDRLMGIYPFCFGLFFCFKAKWEYENNLNVA